MASAQQIDRIVAFGDSYSDPGDAFALGYSNPIALATYPTGRWSGGSNYIDTLSNILNVPVENFSIGGAFGGTNNGTLCFDPPYGAPLCGKGLQYEVDQFLNVGTQSSVFPTSTGTFDQHDLVTLSIGGNDARIYQQLGGTLADAPVAGAAAAVGASAQVDRLVAAGAPTISYLAGDTGRLPEVAGTPSLAAIRSAYSSAFNSSMQTTLAGYAADGVIVHYLDLNLVADNIIADPSAFGISNTGPCPVAQATQCVIDPTFVNQYLFYVDALHLTSRGFEIVGQYVARQLDAPLTLQAPSDLGLDTARQFGRTLSSRSDLYGRGNAAEGLQLFAIGDTFSRDLGISDDNARFDIDGVGATIGAEYGLPTGSVGIAGNWSRPRVRFGDDSARIDAHSWQVGAYGSIGVGGLFGQAHLGYGWDTNKIARQGVVEDMRARPDGTHVTAGAKAGYLVPLGPVRIGPIAAVDYARAKVDSYSETGDPALTLDVGRQSLKAATGQLGLEARADFTGIKTFAAATAEHDFSGDDRIISFAQSGAPVIVNHWTVARGKHTYARVSGGASATLWGATTIDAALSGTIARDGGQEFGAQFGLRTRF